MGYRRGYQILCNKVGKFFETLDYVLTQENETFWVGKLPQDAPSRRTIRMWVAYDQAIIIRLTQKAGTSVFQNKYVNFFQNVIFSPGHFKPTFLEGSFP